MQYVISDLNACHCSDIKGTFIGARLNEALSNPATATYKYSWIDGTIVTDAQWDKMASTDPEPDHFDTEKCLRIDHESFLLRTTRCSKRYAYLCHKPN